MLDMFGMEIMLSQRTLALVVVVDKAVRAVLLEEVAEAVMVVMAVTVEDLNQLVQLDKEDKVAVEVIETNRVADTEVQAAKGAIPTVVVLVEQVLLKCQPVTMEV